MSTEQSRIMASGMETNSITLRKEVVSNSTGFALDIGGSVAKLIYRPLPPHRPRPSSNLDATEQTEDQLCLRMFPREHLHDIIPFVRDHCDLAQGPEDRTVFSTGIGGTEFKKQMEDALSVRLNNLNEFSCFVEGLNTILETYGADSFLPCSLEEGTPGDDTPRTASSFEDPMVAVSKAPREMHEAEGAASTELLPCLLVTCGSATAFTKVNADGSGQLVDGCIFAGRAFMGLSGILTGNTNFDELLQIANQGNSEHVDIFLGDLKESGIHDNFYTQLRDDIKIYAFGKGTQPPEGGFKPADLVRSLLELLCTNLAQLAHITAILHGVKNAYFCGNFVNGHLVRHLIATYFQSRNKKMPPEHQVQVKFLRHGGYLGVIGAFAHDSEGKPKSALSPWETQGLASSTEDAH